MAGYKFGARSKYQLSTCAPDLRRVFERALSFGVIDFTVLEGHRGKAKQNTAFLTGKSKIAWPHGRHNPFPSEAGDVAPWIAGAIPWEDSRPWYVLNGVLLTAAALEGVPIRTGADWDGDLDFTDQTFNDLGHIELAARTGALP